jgi:hypothetical protein
MTSYNKQSVDQAIASSNRAGRRIGGKEAKLIHALLKGRDPLTRASIDSGKLAIIKG